jgi:hypothetical protein
MVEEMLRQIEVHQDQCVGRWNGTVEFEEFEPWLQEQEMKFLQQQPRPAVPLEGSPCLRFDELRSRKLIDSYSLGNALMALEAYHSGGQDSADLAQGTIDRARRRTVPDKDKQLMQKWTTLLLDNIDTRQTFDIVIHGLLHHAGHPLVCIPVAHQTSLLEPRKSTLEVDQTLTPWVEFVQKFKPTGIKYEDLRNESGFFARDEA